MPWKVSSLEEQRMRLVVDLLERDRSTAEICRAHGVSRPTAYKWLERYESGGFGALADRSRAPLHAVGGTPEAVTAAIVDLRYKHPLWGPKKLRAWLQRERAEMVWPACSTIGDLLQRQGLRAAPPKIRHATAQTQPFVEPVCPNDLWCIDFKGWFRTADGQRCDPLTITDAVSRYLLCCSIAAVSMAGVWPVCERLFHEHGQPGALRMDNGSPFGSTGAAGLTPLSVRWIKLGIRLEPIVPGCPQQNGRHERMHRTLKAETSRPPSATLSAQQERFDTFRHAFNEDRPHEGIGQKTPASLYKGQGTPYTGRLDDPWYDADHRVQRVLGKGEIRWNGALVYITESLAGELIGLQELPTGDWVARFCRVDLGILQRKNNEFLRFSAPRPGRTEPENECRRV